MLEVLKDFDKETSIGLIMVVVGILVWFEMAKFVGIGLVVYGVSQMFWKKDEIVQTIEEHHHHHHHNNNKPQAKKQPKKKNYKRT